MRGGLSPPRPAFLGRPFLYLAQWNCCRLLSIRMKKYAWGVGLALVGMALAGVRAKWRIAEILGGAVWGAILGFVIGLAAELKSDIKGEK